MGDTFASFQIWGRFPESNDFLKITCSIGASSAWRVCTTMVLNWSGLAALWGFRDLSSFSMPFTEICIWGIWLYWLDGKGKLHSLSFSSWSFHWAKELKRCGDLGLKTDWNCLFRHLISHNRQRGSFRPTSMGLRHLSLVLNAWVVNTSF